jgi:hypothetical protein
MWQEGKFEYQKVKNPCFRRRSAVNIKKPRCQFHQHFQPAFSCESQTSSFSVLAFLAQRSWQERYTYTVGEIDYSINMVYPAFIRKIFPYFVLFQLNWTSLIQPFLLLTSPASHEKQNKTKNILTSDKVKRANEVFFTPSQLRMFKSSFEKKIYP